MLHSRPEAELRVLMYSICQLSTANDNITSLKSILRKQRGLSAIEINDTITRLANSNGVCRKIVRKARDKILTAVDSAFSQKQSDVQFHLPVTKKRLEPMVLGLMLITRASSRSIKALLNDIFDCFISLGKLIYCNTQYLSRRC